MSNGKFCMHFNPWPCRKLINDGNGESIHHCHPMVKRSKTFPNERRDSIFPLHVRGGQKKEKRGMVMAEGVDGVFLRGNLHVKEHKGKTLPPGNWSLIGSEVKRDQLALLEW